MNTTYITGHKNPDMDSVCAAYAYANLKQQTDNENRYIPIRCGAMNAQTKRVFSYLSIKAPELMTDINPKVYHIAKRDTPSLHFDDPVYMAIEELDKNTISMVPVFDSNEEFLGTVSLHEISAFLVNENLEARPLYNFIPKNIPKVVPGRLHAEGRLDSFNAPLMIGAMPYEISIDRIEQLGDTLPLLVVGLRKELISYAIEENFPGIILTGVKESDTLPPEIAKYSGLVYISTIDTAETARLLRLSSPVQDIINQDIPRLNIETSIKEAKKQLLSSELRGLPVFDNGVFYGIVTRRCFIEPPRFGLIMVDHNELEQSVQGAENAVLHEIVDHHRVGLPKTREPILVDVRPLGSTCTIIYQKYKTAGISISKELAIIMLSGILSDTVLLKSPTATDSDEAAIKELASIAGINWEEWGNDIFSHAATLKKTSPQTIVESDFKTYEHHSIHIGIGQVEVSAFEEIPEVQDSLLEYMNKTAISKGLNWVLLLITNVLKENSRLITTEAIGCSPKLIYEEQSKNLYNLPGILSRKKQLLPEVLRAIDECNEKKK